MEQPEIKIENLLVRPWRPEDADAIFHACQDPEIQRWISIPRPYEMAHAVGYVSDVSISVWEKQSGAHFGVFDAGSGELLGAIGLVGLNRTAKTAEVGYWMAPGARGRGVATTAGRAVAAWAIERLGVERLVWQADVGNHASRLVALRIGFQMEGTLRGGLSAADGSGSRTDGWIAALRPGEVTLATPAPMGPGSAIAKRAHTFGRPMPTLSMPGGALRPHTDDDIDPAMRACQDPETRRWTTVPANYQRSDAESFVRDYARRSWLEGHAGIFVIADESGAYCGAIDLRISAKDPAIGEIGIQVAPWARGHGLAVSAARTLCAWGFQDLDLVRIVWRAHVGNDGSRRTAEKAGFIAEGIQRGGCPQRGERHDAWVGSMLATDSAW